MLLIVVDVALVCRLTPGIEAGWEFEKRLLELKYNK